MFIFGSILVSLPCIEHCGRYLWCEMYIIVLLRCVVVVVVLTLTRIIKSVVTGQAPVTLELRNTPGQNDVSIGEAFALLRLLLFWTLLNRVTCSIMIMIR